MHVFVRSLAGAFIGAWMFFMAVAVFFVAYGSSYEAQLLGGGDRFKAEAIVLVELAAVALGAVLGSLLAACLAWTRRD